MRLTGLIEYCALVAGAVAIVAGKYFSLHKGVELGYFLIGFSFLIGGLVSIYTMQTSSPFSARGANNWSGAQAIIFGLMQLLAGAALIGHAYALSAGRWPTIINYISARPGPVLAAVGLVLTGAGLLLIIGVGKTNSTLRFVLTGIPRMLFGVTFLGHQCRRLGLVRSSRLRALCERPGGQTQLARANITVAQGSIGDDITCVNRAVSRPANIHEETSAIQNRRYHRRADSALQSSEVRRPRFQWRRSQSRGR